MVSFFSLFSSLRKKKKAKRASTSTPASPSDPTSSSQTQSKARFFSLRSRSSTRPSLVPRRSTSNDSLRRRKEQVQQRAQKSRQEKLELPKLDFEVQAPNEGEGEQSPLGLESVGRRPVLRTNEVVVVQGLRLGVQEVAQGWKCFGKALKEYGVQEPGIFLPRQNEGDENTQRYLLALFVLSIRPALAAQLPSITSSFPTTPTTDTSTNTASQNGDTASSSSWSERLQVALSDRPNPHDVAEILKFLLRRVLPPGTPAKPTHTPRLDASPGVLGKTTVPLDTTTYTTFVRAEFAASYPLDAYGTLLKPKLDNDLALYLEDIFDVWADIVAYSDLNQMTAGRICLLLGWWVWGSGPDARQQQQGWKALYDDWLVAASRIEHLFFAWIRWQSTLQTLPINLIQLVKDYPFGESSASSDHLPSPPPSSFSRQTLHVTLASERPLDKARLVPREIIRLALPCHAASDTPLWTSITRTGNDARVKIIEEFLSDDSTRVLHTDQPTAVKDDDRNTPDLSGNTDGTAKDEESFYRPFSSIARRPLDLSESHRRSLSSLSASSPSNHRESYIPQQSPIRLNGETSSSDLQSAADAPAWNDFEQIGFGDSPIATELLLSPPVALNKVDHPVRINQDATRQKPTSPKRPVIPSSQEGYSIISEDVVKLDDMFLPYVEDGQFDSYATKTWPPFALIRLDSPLQSSTGSGNSHTVEWLFITIEYRPPPTPVLEAEDANWLPRPTSPGAASSTSRMSSFSFRDFSANFRRSSSYGVKQGGFRRSLLGTSSRTLSNDASLSQKPLPSLAPVDLGQPISASTKAPTEITVGEMGDIVKKPRSSLAALAETRGDGQIQGAKVSEDTEAGDWHYKAEGGAHLIFVYTGSLPLYRGKVLRIRKVGTAGDDAQMAVADKWRDHLLPKLVPSKLLVPALPVTVSFTFVRELMLSANGIRPDWRKTDQSTSEGDVRAWLLEDLSTVDHGGNDRHAVSVEIKPKWGFLPSPEFLHPPESVAIKSRVSRFVMHQHLRDAANSEGKSYDPLDLYSGDEERMQRGIDGLFAGWKATEGKGNNLRLSIDGVTVLPGKTSLSPVSSHEELLSALSGPLILNLQSSGALKILRDLQSRLDATDISDLARRSHLAHPNSELFDPSLLPEPTVQELSDFVDLYLSAPSDGVAEDRWTLRQRLIAYTLSAIFKDCSIFVTIPFSYSGNQLAPVQGDSKVRLIDLDLKPISSLRKWYDLDDQIWRHWLSTHTDGNQSSAINAEPNTPRPLNVNSLDVAGLSPKKASFSPSPERSLLGTPLSTSRPDGMANIASPSDTPQLLSQLAENRDEKGSVTEDALANSPAHDFFGQESARGDTEESSRFDDEASGEPRMRRSPAPSPSPRPDASGGLTEDFLEPAEGGADSETKKVQGSGIVSSQPYSNGTNAVTYDSTEHNEEMCQIHNIPIPGPKSPFTLLRSSDQVTLAHSVPNHVHVDNSLAKATSSDLDPRLTVEHHTQ